MGTRNWSRRDKYIAWQHREYQHDLNNNIQKIRQFRQFDNFGEHNMKQKIITPKEGKKIIIDYISEMKRKAESR